MRVRALYGPPSGDTVWASVWCACAPVAAGWRRGGGGSWRPVCEDDGRTARATSRMGVAVATVAGRTATAEQTAAAGPHPAGPTHLGGRPAPANPSPYAVSSPWTSSRSPRAGVWVASGRDGLLLAYTVIMVPLHRAHTRHSGGWKPSTADRREKEFACPTPPLGNVTQVRPGR